MKAVVGRNESENERMSALSRDDDLLLEAVDFTGPVTLLRGTPRRQDILFAAAVTARYGKGRQCQHVKVCIAHADGTRKEDVEAGPASEQDMDRVRVAAPGSRRAKKRE